MELPPIFPEIRICKLNTGGRSFSQIFSSKNHKGDWTIREEVLTTKPRTIVKIFTFALPIPITFECLDKNTQTRTEKEEQFKIEVRQFPNYYNRLYLSILDSDPKRSLIKYGS